MLNKALIVLSVLLVGAFVFGITRPDLFAPAPKPAETDFRAQTVELDPDVRAAAINPKRLLEQALERLAPERTIWLKTKIRQTMIDVKTSFTAEGTLQRGPGNAARLEMDIVTNGTSSRLLLVSDGKVLAEVKTFPNRPPIEQFTALQIEGQKPPIPVDLNTHGCGGPVALLDQLRQRLHDAKLQTGLLHGVAVVQIKGDFNAEKLVAFANTSIPARSACVYLDAKTLWPIQFEWWGTEKDQSLRRLLQIEFPDPELNHELAAAECERLFSYRPQGNVGAVVPE
jgi:hypothetical protein